MREVHSDDPIKCECGRVVAFMKDGKIYVKCKTCKRIVQIIEVKNHKG